MNCIERITVYAVSINCEYRL